MTPMARWTGWPLADTLSEWHRDLIRAALVAVGERRHCGAGWPEPGATLPDFPPARLRVDDL